MAGETYYFAFSLIAVIGIVLHVVNLVYLKNTGKTILGDEFKPDTAGYKKFKNLTSGRAIATTSFIGLIFTANLIYDVYRILHLDKPDYARFILIYFSIGTILFAVIMLFVMRERLESGKPR
jgi:hypothetical protein